MLADEVNRTPPKTQAALLEAMQERQVTVGGERHRLPDPFFVLATQNPIEQEGTYPLPEAQLDRFMLNIMVDYPDEEEELEIVRMTTSTHRPNVTKVLSGAEILELQEIVRKVPVADHVARYAVRLTRQTRREKGEVPDFIRDYVSWGAGPRPVSTSSWPPRPALCCSAATTWRSKTSGPWPVPFSGTGSSPTSMPRPKGSGPTRSSSG